MNVLVTGGASGLGEAITRAFCKTQKYFVHFTFNSSKEKAKTLEHEFTNCKSFFCDFKNPEMILELQGSMEKMNLDILINNAYSGKFIENYFHKTPAQHFENDFQINVLPTIKITQTAIEHFRKKKSGIILTVLTSALDGIPPLGASSYLGVKAYLAEMVKVWAAENSKFNIISKAISPSLMLTAMTDTLDERMIEQIRENTPNKKLLTTQETAEKILSLCHNPTTNGNGQNLFLKPGY